MSTSFLPQCVQYSSEKKCNAFPSHSTAEKAYTDTLRVCQGLVRYAHPTRFFSTKQGSLLTLVKIAFVCFCFPEEDQKSWPVAVECKTVEKII